MNNIKKKIVITIQARMGATRFPGKTLAKLGRYSVLEYMFRRLKRSKSINDIYLATTNSGKDISIVELAERINLKYYRGSEEDVLGRVYETARLADADIIVETTADCPMIDASLIDEGLGIYLNSNYDCVGVGINKSYPHGLDFYIISMDLLEDMNKKARTPYQREHVIEYVTSQPERFNCFYLKAPPRLNRPDVRITVDYREDLEIMKKIIGRIEEDRFDYSIEDIITAWDAVTDKKFSLKKG